MFSVFLLENVDMKLIVEKNKVALRHTTFQDSNPASKHCDGTALEERRHQAMAQHQIGVTNKFRISQQYARGLAALAPVHAVFIGKNIYSISYSSAKNCTCDVNGGNQVGVK